MSELSDKVTRELERYEHPLFAFAARPAPAGVEVEIRFKPSGADVHTYFFTMQPREIEHAQFPWTFQRQLYDCLHDYVVEMFIRNPQQKDS
jgi:hypothetical protein